MAATDMFESFLSSLSTDDKEKLKDFIKDQRNEMFAARSEDARVRIASDFIHEVKARLNKHK